MRADFKRGVNAVLTQSLTKGNLAPVGNDQIGKILNKKAR